MDPDDEDLWAPFLASRTPDRQAARLRAHAREDQRRGQQHLPRRAAALSRDEIVRVAISVADAEGADAVTMRRIARELSAGTMSLYWHIASKEELLDLMIDDVQGGRPLPDPSGDWRQDMDQLARNTRQSLHQHPWMMDFLGGPATGRYPKMLELLDDNVDPDAAETRDARFEFGLTCLLDGIAARLPSHPAPG